MISSLHFSFLEDQTLPLPSSYSNARSSGSPCWLCLLSRVSTVLVIEIPCWQPSSGKPMEMEGFWCTWHCHVGGRWESVLTACHENNLLSYNLKHTSFHSHTQPWCRLFITVRENRLWLPSLFIRLHIPSLIYICTLYETLGSLSFELWEYGL